MKQASATTVKPSECVGSHEGNDQDSRPQDEDVLRFAQIETADPTDQQVADGKIKQAP